MGSLANCFGARARGLRVNLQPRRWRGVAAAVVIVALGLMTACGSNTEMPVGSPSVTISHKFGETTVPANPQRVVTVGWTDQDFVLPFGVVPVSTRDFFDEYNDYP